MKHLSEKAPLSPDAAGVKANPLTMERELIFGTIRHYLFYREIRDIICPYDPVAQRYRKDFTVKPYNILYAAVDQYWRRFEDSLGAEDMMIPTEIVRAFLVDWANANQKDFACCELLVKEFEGETELLNSITLESCRALIQSQGFHYWLDGRVLESINTAIQQDRNLGTQTLASLRKILDAAENSSVGALRNTARPLNEFQVPTTDDDVILGPGRALCRKGIGLLAGMTGLGKSALSMQLAICCAIGRECFGLRPPYPLRILIIQAENDDGDVAEMRDGVYGGLSLSAEERSMVSDRIMLFSASGYAGEKFSANVLDHLLGRYNPDLVIIDPALAFLGGDAKDQSHVGAFLRERILGAIKKFNCACLLLHHFNKPNGARGNGNLSTAELSYLASGSIEWANIPRIIFNLTATPVDGINILSVPKRGYRLGWKDASGAPTVKRYLKHSDKPGQICWFDSSEEEFDARKSANRKKPEDVDELILALVPENGAITQRDLFVAATKTHNFGKNRVRTAVKSLIESKRLSQGKQPNQKGPALVTYSKTKDDNILSSPGE